MSASDDYLANLGLDASDFTASINQITTLMGHFTEIFPQADAAVSRLETSLQKLAGTDASKSVTDTGNAAAKSTTQWNEYAQALAKAQQAYSAAQRSNASQGIVNTQSGLPSDTDSANLLRLQAASQANVTAAVKANAAAIGEQTDATNKALNPQKTYQQNLGGIQYALYNVSTAAAVAGAALVAPAVAAETTSIQYEKLFADVARTSTELSSNGNVRNAQLDTLKQQLIDITTQLPITFAQVTQIATLGNQLGIPATALTDFTQVVAKFSATTNVSVDASATAFGRLGQLLNTTDYKKLGDDIAYLGVKSVATETQIINTAQQIAVAGNAAGFTEPQVISLSAALASLGTAPEQARGVIQQTFADISKAVEVPGAKLNELAAISGTTSTAFAKEWKADAAGAFQSFLSGLGENTGTITENLNALGLTSIRTVQSISALAQNSKLVGQLFSDAGDSAGYLDKSYAQIATTVSSKLTVAQNNLLAVFNEIGTATKGPVAAGLDAFNNALTITQKLLSDPVFSTGAAIVVGFGALLGVAALLSAALFRTAGAVASMNVAEGGGTGITGLYVSALKILTGQSTAAAAAQTELAVAEGAAGDAAVASAGEQTIAGDAAVGLGSKLKGAATSGLALVESMGPLGVAGAIGAMALGIGVGIEALIKYVDTTDGAIQSTDQYTSALLKLQAGSASAGDTISKSFGTSVAINGTTTGANNPGAAGRFGNVGNYSNAGTTPTRSIGGLKAEANYATTGDYVPGGTTDQNATAATELRNVTSNLTAYDAALSKLATGGNLKAAQKGLADFTAEAEKQGVSAKDIAKLLPEATAAIDGNANASKSAAQAASDLAAGGTAGTTALTALINTTYGAANASLAVSTSLESLGEAFVNNGAAAASNGPEIQKVISDIYAEAGGGPAAANQLEALYLELLKLGSTKGDLAGLASVISSLADGKKVTADSSGIDLSKLTDGYNTASAAAAKTAQSTQAAAAAVKTLSDYGSDLQGVFSRATDIQFGPSEGADKITSDWQNIKTAVTAANKSIQDSVTSTRAKILDLNNTIDGLKSDNSLNEYFLTIAKNYGDTLRTGELTSSIADNNSKIKDAQTSIAQAQADNATTVAAANDTLNKSLDGNSAAAIANRAQIESLVTDYQGYIVKLASSGLSQDQLKAKTEQLKQQFIQQATQLGYTKSGVDQAASSFDGMALAIEKIPRNITVTANTDPAQQAINEFIANSKKNAAAGVTVPIKTSFSGDGTKALDTLLDKIAKKEQATGQVSYYTGQLTIPNLSEEQRQADLKALNAAAATVASLKAFKSGGYTGSGDPNSTAGVVHYDEFVLNSVGRQFFSMAELNAANQGRAPQSMTVNNIASTNSSGTGPLQLSPYDRQLLQTIADRVGITLTGGALQAANNTANMNSTARNSN